MVNHYGPEFDPSRDAAPKPTGGEWDAAQDGMLLRAANVRSVRREDRKNPVTGETRKVVVADWVASTEAEDSYESILVADWDQDGRLDRFRANPVLLWMHDRSLQRVPAIGHCEDVRVENRELLLRVVCDDTTEFDREIAEKIAKGILRAGSVGFGWEKAELRTVGDRQVVVFSKNILQEFSIVNVGSNPQALSQRDLVRATRELLIAGGNVGMREAAAAYRAMTGNRTAGQTRAAQPTIAGMPAKLKETRMKTVIVDNTAAEAIRRNGTAELKDGDEAVRVAMPYMATMDAEIRTLSERASTLEKNLAVVTAERDALKSTVDTAKAGERAAVEAATKAVTERNEAVAERAKLTLEPLTGLDAWQMSPAVRDIYAGLAATDPAKFDALVSDYRAKGERAGALIRKEPAAPLPGGDPTPRALPNHDEDPVATATRNVDRRAVASANADTN